MEKFDDKIPTRDFDNFQVLLSNSTVKTCVLSHYLFEFVRY